jgi:hypothetical protein
MSDMQVFPRRPWRIGLIIAAVAGTIALIFRFGLSLTWLGVIAPLTLLAVLGVIAVASGLASDRKRNEFLREKEGLCPCCRYERRGLSSDAPCPECGRAVSPPT